VLIECAATSQQLRTTLNNSHEAAPTDPFFDSPPLFIHSVSNPVLREARLRKKASYSRTEDEEYLFLKRN
jgi:hypothetical protein